MKRFLKLSLVLFFFININIKIFAIDYGSDTTVAITSVTMPSGVDNIIKSFGWAKHGLTFQDFGTTVTFQSGFPISGPIDMQGGVFYLDTDLILSNTATFLSLGTINAYNHVLSLSESTTNLRFVGSTSGGSVLSLIARSTETSTIPSVGWSYDSNYVAAIGGNNLFVYSFSNNTLTKVTTRALGAPGTSMKWHPTQYYIATGRGVATNELRIHSFTPPNSTAITDNFNFTGTALLNALAWNPNGIYLATGTNSNTQTISVFSFSSGTVSNLIHVANANQDVSENSLVWAPPGNGNYLAAGLTNDSTNPELVLYNFIPNTTMTLTANAFLNQTVNALDWSPTGSYLAVGLSGGENRLRIYKYDVNRGAASSYAYLQEATRLDETQTVNSVNWSSDGSKLIVGLDAGIDTEFRIYSFSSSPTPTISLFIGIEASSNVNSVKFSGDDTYIARGDDSDFVSIYKLIAQSAFAFRDVNIFLNNNLTLQSPLTFQGICSIDAHNNILELTDQANLNVKPNSTLSIKQTNLQISNPGTFALENRSSILKFQDSEISLNSDATIGDGSLDILGDLVITGPYTLNYETTITSTIESYSTLKIDGESTFAVGRNPTTSRPPLEFIDNTSSLEINDSTLNITNSGFNITKGKVKILGQSIFDINSTDTNYGIILGDTTTANDPILEIKAGSELVIKNGSLVMNTNNNENLELYSDSSKLTFSDYQSSLQIQRGLNISNGTISPKTQNNIYVSDNAYLSANSIKFADQTTKEEFFLTGTIQNANNIILDQNDLLTLTVGNLSKIITVSRNNNTIRGIGGLSGQLNMIYNQSDIMFNLNSIDNNNIDLNKNKITFQNDSSFVKDYIFTGSGSIDLTHHTLAFSSQDTLHTSTIYWQATDGKIELNAQISLTGTWTFRGNFVIYGNNNTLDLGSSGQIFVEGDSTLQFKDLAIQNLRNSNIKCTTNEGQLILNNCILSQSSDFTFTYGSIEFMNQNYLQAKNSSGSNFTFYYDTTQTSTIKSISSLAISTGITFKLGKKISASTVQPLEFEDTSSILNLDGCTIHVTSSGMQLLRGEILITDNSILDIDAANYGTGFLIGDGTNSDNDFIIKIGGGNKLIINSGKLFYNNVNSENKIIFTSLASAIRVESTLGLVTKRDLKIVNGTLLFPLNDSIQTLDNSSFQQDNITHIHDSPYAIHKSKAHMKKKVGSVYPTEYYIYDTGYFYSLEGQADVPLNIESGTITIGGPGLIGAQTVIKDSNTSIATNATPNYKNDITLNGGTLTLDTDLKFIGNKKLSGSGIINLNNSKMSFGTDELTFSDPIYWNSSSGIELNAKTTLSTTWTINGIYNLNGHGNILEIIPGGRIEIRPDSTLFLTDIAIKGLGDGFGRFILNTDSSQINMSNVYIELDNNYSTTIGGIYVEGPTTFGLKNYDWTFDQQASLTIDGVTLWQDPLDKINYGTIVFGPGPISKYLSLTSSGTIKTCANLDILATDTQNLAINIKNNSNAIMLHDRYFETIDHGYQYLGNRTYQSLGTENAKDLEIHQVGTLYRLNSDIYLSKDHTLTLPTDITQIDGNGHTINFARENNSGILIIPDSTTITTTNVVFRGFNANNVTIGSDSEFIFGDNTTIELLDNQDLNQTWSFVGNTILNGFGNELKLQSHLDRINVIGANSRLIIQDMKLENVRFSNVHCTHRNSAITLRNCDIFLDYDYNFTIGTIDFDQNIVIHGTHAFVYETNFGSTIDSNANVLFDLATTFSYAPTVADRNLLIMSDASSMLKFDGATLHSTTTGLRLTNGTIVLDHKNYIYNQDGSGAGTSVSQAISFGNGINPDNDLKIEIMPGGSIEIKTGILDYRNLGA
ncbi:MAG: hypothetical protein WC436_04935 [Candidatus Babeliales bacterium]